MLLPSLPSAPDGPAFGNVPRFTQPEAVET